MSTLIIKGGKKLKGKVKIAGMKNAATPILAACLLAQKKCVIKNIPDILDVRVMIEILKGLGLNVRFENHTAIIEPGKINIKNLDEKLVKKLRSSILILGPLFSQFKKISLPEPGGCIIGKRPIDTHLLGFEKLGGKISHKKDKIFLERGDLEGVEIVLREFSVTATENIIMASVLAKGKTAIKLAAIEPHVLDLVKFLNKMGAKIKVLPEHTIIIEGVKKLGGAEHRVIPDSIEVGTFAVAGLVTEGDIVLCGLNHKHMDAVYNVLEEAGAGLEKNGNNLRVFYKGRLKSFKLQTMPYPGFPTDLQAPFSVLAAKCSGASLIHDPMYEGRLGHIGELSKMGLRATICDPHRVIIEGGNKLKGTEIKGLDLRAGATLVLAGLIAEGETIVRGVENLDRGYEKFDERLRGLGAEISRNL